MFTDKTAVALIAAAKANGIEPAAMLAIVEVETGGKMFEDDGRTPSLLYERHVAYREANKRSPSLLARFRSAGLALPKWNPPAQYQDERSSPMRLALIEKARGIDPEVADRSASWGLGQTMGFLCTDLGFETAQEMVEHMVGSMTGQIDCMVRELKHSHLIEPLNAHDWPHVARIYNGAGYAKNAYDKKLAAAYARWVRKVSTIMPAGDEAPPRPTPPEQHLSSDEVKQIQMRLRDLGYAEVGDPDGHWDTRVTGAVSAFQAHEGITVTGHYDDVTAAALNTADERPIAIGRALTTADDLKAGGSDTIAHADNASWWAKLKMGAGATFVGGGTASQMGLLDNAQNQLDKVNQARGMWGQVHDIIAPVFASTGVIVAGVILIAAGIAVYYAAQQIRARRVDDHRTGVHAGPSED
jgi:hypothetical protein